MKIVSMPSLSFNIPAPGIDPPLLISAGAFPVAFLIAALAARIVGLSIGVVTPNPP